MNADRCYDCGGLWKQREHRIGCPHYRKPRERVRSGPSTPLAMDIGGADVAMPVAGPLPAVSFAVGTWKQESFNV